MRWTKLAWIAAAFGMGATVQYLRQRGKDPRRHLKGMKVSYETQTRYSTSPDQDHLCLAGHASRSGHQKQD